MTRSTTVPPPVRAATERDLPALPAVEAAADERFRDTGRYPLPPPATVDELRAAYLLLVAGEPPVGYARVELVDGLAHLEGLSVHPDHGRRGHGGALLEAAFRTCVEAGHPAMTLVTFADIPWNAPFYAAHGFTPLAELTPELAALREHERRLGLDALGTRVVLRRTAR